MATITPSTQVDTAHVSGRRKIRFNDHDEVLADVERLAAGGYRQLGNWSLGQIATHLAAAMNIALDGAAVRAALPMRLVARLIFKNKVIRGPMKPGFKLPAKFASSLIPDATADQQGIETLRTAVRRWKTEPQRHPHGFFGPLTAEEWEKIMLNHAAMHLSFLVAGRHVSFTLRQALDGMPFGGAAVVGMKHLAVRAATSSSAQIAAVIFIDRLCR